MGIPVLTENRYVDGEIVREGVYGDQGDGAYSAGVSTCPAVFQDLDPGPDPDPDPPLYTANQVYSSHILTTLPTARRRRKHRFPNGAPNLESPPRRRDDPRVSGSGLYG